MVCFDGFSLMQSICHMSLEDVRATDEELEALPAELASVRAASASTLPPAGTVPGDSAWRGPPGLTHPEDEAEQRLSCSFHPLGNEQLKWMKVVHCDLSKMNMVVFNYVQLPDRIKY